MSLLREFDFQFLPRLLVVNTPSLQYYILYQVILKYVNPLKRYGPWQPDPDHGRTQKTPNQKRDVYVELTASWFDKISINDIVNLW